jgi:adenylate kinase
MIHLILFGPPGSGKGTQAEKLIKKYNLFHISTGDLFRAETSLKTPLGLKALEYMSQGKLVPDEITIGMLKNKLSELNHVSGIIYDGFPRTIAQAEALDKLLAEDEEEIRVLVALEVPDDEIVSRILKRGATSGRSDDNDESIIRRRMEEYRQKTSEVYSYYDRFGKSRSINGLGSIDDIFDRICHEIDQHL